MRHFFYVIFLSLIRSSLIKIGSYKDLFLSEGVPYKIRKVVILSKYASPCCASMSFSITAFPCHSAYGGLFV